MNKASTQASEHSTINVLDDDHIQFWTAHFSISERELRNAVFIAGPLVVNVKNYLQKRESKMDRMQ